MLKGVNLTLMIGPVVPIPVSKVVLDALTDVEVITSTDGPSVFRLNFELSLHSPIAKFVFSLRAGTNTDGTRHHCGHT